MSPCATLPSAAQAQRILIEASSPADFDTFDPLAEEVLSTLAFLPAETTPAP